MKASAKRKASLRLKRINALADQEQKKAGYKTKTVKVPKLSRKTALKRAGKKYRALNRKK